MKYQDFVDGLLEYAAKAGETIHFHHDKEQGKYIGITSSGAVFTGNSCSFKITVKDGSFESMFELKIA